MRIALPRESRRHEYRVALLPEQVRALVAAGHSVFVQCGAGEGAGFDDAAYADAGARLLAEAEAVFSAGELVVKVKEPGLEECGWLCADQTLFTYLHLAAVPDIARALIVSGCTAIGYETVSVDGRLPLLAPMSRIAGRYAVQAGARALERECGGAGILLAGDRDEEAGDDGVRVAPARVLVLGGGSAGAAAARVACGMGAEVTVLEKQPQRVQVLARALPQARIAGPDQLDLAESVAAAELLIATVLVPGARTPQLVSRAMVRRMRRGAAIVDVAIDQGGACESSRPTALDAPTYVAEGVVHNAVANMPGAVPRTSTLALTRATFPYVEKLAAMGVDRALAEDAGLRAGLNLRAGAICHPAVAEALAEAL